jgi:hypothetical protein
VARRSHDGNGLGAKHVFFLAMTSAGLAVVVFLLGVMVGRGVSVVEMITGHGSASASGDEPVAADERPSLVSTGRREPSVAATDGAELSYYERLDEDRGMELDARLQAPDPTADAGDANGAGEGSAASAGSAAPFSGYAVHLTTLREGAAAHRMAQGLVDKGYPAFVVAPVSGAPVQVFRVRVGTYADRVEAERVLRRLETEESFRPWITRQ